jgi:hypothetical protein
VVAREYTLEAARGRCLDFILSCSEWNQVEGIWLEVIMIAGVSGMPDSGLKGPALCITVPVSE